MPAFGIFLEVERLSRWRRKSITLDSKFFYHPSLKLAIIICMLYYNLKESGYIL